MTIGRSEPNERAFEAWRGPRVRFGEHWLEALPAAVAALQGRRAALITSPRRRALADLALAALGEVGVVALPLAQQHVPIGVVDTAARLLDAAEADTLVAVGGGSAIGLGKALQVRRKRGFVAVPTTYSGSEMTPVYGVLVDGEKRVGRDDVVRPDEVVYDPELTLALPLSVTVPSLFNAMAHAVDALYGRDGLTSAPPAAAESLARWASEAIGDLEGALRRLITAPSDREARTMALQGAHRAGAILANAAMALHHRLAHVLGGSFGLPHAETHAVLLPHVVAYNAACAPAADRLVAEALGGEHAAEALFALACRTGAPTRLDALGFRREQIAEAVARLEAGGVVNARPVEGHAIARMLEAALCGEAPRSDGGGRP